MSVQNPFGEPAIESSGDVRSDLCLTRTKQCSILRNNGVFDD